MLKAASRRMASTTLNRELGGIHSRALDEVLEQCSESFLCFRILAFVTSQLLTLPWDKDPDDRIPQPLLLHGWNVFGPHLPHLTTAF